MPSPPTVHRTSIDDPAYAAVLAATPGAPPSAHPSVVAAFARAARLEAGALIALRDGRPAGAVPLLLRRRGIWTLADVPPQLPYLGPLLPPGESAGAAERDESVLGALADAASAAAHRVTWHVPPPAQDVRPLSWRGWTCTLLYTYRHDLGAPFEPSAATARAIRKHGSAYTLHEDAAIEAVIDLASDAYGRHGRGLPLGRDAATRAAHAVREAGFARVFTARRDGATHAGVVLIADGRGAEYWIAGSRPGPAMAVLMAGVLERLASGGYTSFDWVGANTPSIAEFKRRMGATLMPYVRATHARGMLRAYERLRR